MCHLISNAESSISGSIIPITFFAISPGCKMLESRLIFSVSLVLMPMQTRPAPSVFQFYFCSCWCHLKCHHGGYKTEENGGDANLFKC